MVSPLFFLEFLCGAVMAEITSANVVGYQTATLADNNFTMISVPFVHVENDGSGLQLNSDISVANLKGGDNSEAADRIWVWVPSKDTYANFFYYDDGEEAGWVDDANADYIEECEGWEDGIPQGTAMYFKALGTGKALTGSGAVDGTDEVELALAANTFTMIANPYPVATQLNGDYVTISNIVGSENENTSDRIWIWNPTKLGYDKFFYYDDGEEAGWVDDANADYIEEIEGWEDGIPAGQGMYFKALGAGKTITFKSPLAK